MAITFRHAGAGSGKTYSIVQDIATRLESGGLSPERLIAVTFTNRAADELLERIGTGLLARGRPDLAALLDQARVGTVNSVCGQLLQELCFELGLSPVQRVITDLDRQLLFNEALDESLTPEVTATLNALATRLAQEDWQSEVLSLVDQARANTFTPEDLGRFAEDSVAGLLQELPPCAAAIDETGLRAAMRVAREAGRQVVNPTQGLQTSLDRLDQFLRPGPLT